MGINEEEIVGVNGRGVGGEKNEATVHLANVRGQMDELLKEVYSSAQNDAETQTSIRVYRNMNLPEAEIERRVTRQYADAHDILFPVVGIPLEENCFTVEECASDIHFEPIDWCLGVVIEDFDGFSYGAHILTDENPDRSKQERSIENYADQIKRFYSSETAKKIRFISTHAEDTAQHQEIIKKLKAMFPEAEVEILKQAHF